MTVGAVQDDSGGDGEWRGDDGLGGSRAPLGSGSGAGKTDGVGVRLRGPVRR